MYYNLYFQKTKQMTVRASSFPSVRLEDRKLERIKRFNQPEIHKKLCEVLLQENDERMKRYWARFMKTRNWEQYQKDCDKQKEFMEHRIKTVLFALLDDDDTKNRLSKFWKRTKTYIYWY